MNLINNKLSDDELEVFIVEDIDPYAPKMGGIATYTQELLGYLAKTGFKVTILGVSNGNGLRHDDGVVLLPVIQKHKYTGYEYLFRLLLKTPFMRIPGSAIIHAHHPGNMLPFSLFRRKNPKILTIHGQVLEKIRLKRNGIVRFIYQKVEAYVLKHVDAVVVVDEVTSDFYQSLYPRMSRPEIIPTGVDLGKFKVMDKALMRMKYGFKPDAKIIAYVGRLEKEKGLGFLLDCFNALKIIVPEALITFIGDGKDKHLLEKQVKELGLHGVVFRGIMEPGVIPEIMNCADVLALCSMYEGSPMVVKEALACGVPVVSTDVGDVRRLVQNGKNGRIVSRNVDDFTGALADMLRISDKETVSKECVSAAAAYSIDLTCSRVTGLYRKVTNGKKNRG